MTEDERESIAGEARLGDERMDRPADIAQNLGIGLDRNLEADAENRVVEGSRWKRARTRIENISEDVAQSLGIAEALREVTEVLHGAVGVLHARDVVDQEAFVLAKTTYGNTEANAKLYTTIRGIRIARTAMLGVIDVKKTVTMVIDIVAIVMIGMTATTSVKDLINAAAIVAREAHHYQRGQ